MELLLGAEAPKIGMIVRSSMSLYLTIDLLLISFSFVQAAGGVNSEHWKKK